MYPTITCEPEVHTNALNPVQLTSEYKVVIFDNEVDFCGKELHYLTVIPPDHNKPIFIATPLSRARLNYFYYQMWETGSFTWMSKCSHGVELHATTTERPDVFETDYGDVFSRVVAASAATTFAERVAKAKPIRCLTATSQSKLRRLHRPPSTPMSAPIPI